MIIVLVACKIQHENKINRTSFIYWLRKKVIEITNAVHNCLSKINIEQIKTIPNLNKLIDSYETGEPQVLKFAQGVRDGSIVLKEGQTVLQGYQSYLQSTTKTTILADLKAKTLTASMQLLSTIGWMAAITASTWVIGKLVESINDAILASENARKKRTS